MQSSRCQAAPIVNMSRTKLDAIVVAGQTKPSQRSRRHWLGGSDGVVVDSGGGCKINVTRCLGRVFAVMDRESAWCGGQTGGVRAVRLAAATASGS
uniref:Uncharacterized protein n=1 Tax=Oryza sativa subsp. japonica TaxID=39947 RepID=Q6Z6N7_ORYSJ|nr:hypothetical protein [Oryza sativa Japonica Group]BAD30994.1 hypothetical protein [Oryza sativa Japonica Group]